MTALRPRVLQDLQLAGLAERLPAGRQARARPTCEPSVSSLSTAASLPARSRKRKSATTPRVLATPAYPHPRTTRERRPHPRNRRAPRASYVDLNHASRRALPSARGAEAFPINRTAHEGPPGYLNQAFELGRARSNAHLVSAYVPGQSPRHRMKRSRPSRMPASAQQLRAEPNAVRFVHVHELDGGASLSGEPFDGGVWRHREVLSP